MAANRRFSLCFLTPPARWPVSPGPGRDRQLSEPDLGPPPRGAPSSPPASDWRRQSQRGTASHSARRRQKNKKVTFTTEKKRC